MFNPPGAVSWNGNTGKRAVYNCVVLQGNGNNWNALIFPRQGWNGRYLPVRGESRKSMKGKGVFSHSPSPGQRQCLQKQSAEGYCCPICLLMFPKELFFPPQYM